MSIGFQAALWEVSHVQVLAAIFIKMECESLPTVENGSLADTANGVAMQLQEDVDILAYIDEALEAEYEGVVLPSPFSSFLTTSPHSDSMHYGSM